MRHILKEETRVSARVGYDHVASSNTYDTRKLPCRNGEEIEGGYERPLYRADAHSRRVKTVHCSGRVVLA